MTNWETTIIPLDDAHEILATFGIDGHNPKYQRWRREAGFRWVDLEDVLNDSPLVLNVDWRACLQDEMETIQEQLHSLGISVSSDFDEDGNRGQLEIENAKESVEYVPNESQDFGVVIESVNRLIQHRAEYRKFRSCEGSDGWSYGLLRHDDWKSLESTAMSTVELLFVPS